MTREQAYRQLLDKAIGTLDKIAKWFDSKNIAAQAASFRESIKQIDIASDDAEIEQIICGGPR